MTTPLVTAGIKALAPVAKELAVTAATQAAVVGATNAVNRSAAKAAKDNTPAVEQAPESAPQR